MTDPMELVGRLEEQAGVTFGTYAGEPDKPLALAAVSDLTEAAACIRELVEELAGARRSVCAFGAPWAVEYARNMGFPDGALHATHYDILEKSGARMVEFTRHLPPAPGAEA